jgi:hypothetical protein
LKIAVLIEDPIIGEIAFAIRIHQLPMVEKAGCVEDISVFIHKTDNGCNGRGGLCNLLDCPRISFDKLEHEQEVFRWVAGNSHFGKNQEVHPHPSSALDIIQNLFCVAFNIPYGRIDLTKTDSDYSHISP